MAKKKKTENVPEVIKIGLPETSDSVKVITYQDQSTFYPLTRSQPIKRDKSLFLWHTLPDIYDINYVITLLRVILDQVEAQKFNPKDLQMTLNHSIKQLLGFLIVERDQR